LSGEMIPALTSGRDCWRSRWSSRAGQFAANRLLAWDL